MPRKALCAYIENLEREKESWKRKYEYSLQEIQLLLHYRFGRSSERMTADDGQITFFTREHEEIGDGHADRSGNEVVVQKHARRKRGGRRPLPSSLPRIQIRHDIDEEDKLCACGAKRQVIREEKSERLVHIPERFYVEEHIRPLYGCKQCEGAGDEDKPALLIAPVVPSIIPKSMVTSSLLAGIVTNKFCDHLPFYRQSRRFLRHGIVIDRQDMSNWIVKAYESIKPLLALMNREIVKSGFIQMDETHTLVMRETGRANTAKSYVWLARGGPPDGPVVTYTYKETRAGKHAAEFLKDFKGYLQCDGYEGYDSAVKDKADIVLVGCFAHVRRKFHDAWLVSKKKSEKAHQGLAYVQEICRLESELREKYKEKETFLEERKRVALPVLTEFKAWCDKTWDMVPPQSSIGKAVGYTIRQWDKLVRYLDHPDITPTNNLVENDVRPYVCGRKNWLISGSPQGAHASCGFMSLIQTAKVNGVNPHYYLQYLFDKVPTIKDSNEFRQLLPMFIDKTIIHEYENCYLQV